MNVIRLETKKWIYTFGRGGRFLLIPAIQRGSSFGFFEWLWWMADWTSKEWIDYCESKGGGLENTFEFVEGLLSDEKLSS